MFVQVRQGLEQESVEIVVLGERLKKDQDGSFLLPGRLVSGLKPEDLPEEICFRLSEMLPSGIMFYREDRVIFCRRPLQNGLEVHVTTTYLTNEWDGMFSLQSTMEARRSVIANTKDYMLHSFSNDDSQFRVSFSFVYADIADCDLEQVLESICEKVRWVEEKSNERLLFGHL